MILKTKYKFALYPLLWLGLPLSLTAANTEMLFKQANTRYAKAKYHDAVKYYRMALGNGYRSAVIYYDMGNAYYKLGDMPSALLYYEKAHKLAPGDEDINFNIQLANLKITDKVEPAPQFFLSAWRDAIILYFSASTWAVLSVILFISGFGLLIFYLFTQSVSLKKTFFFTGAIIIFTGIITLLLAIGQVNYFASHQQAIVFNTSVTVKSEPVTSAKNLFIIHEGTKADVLENNNGWVHIRLINGNEGWVPASDIKAI